MTTLGQALTEAYEEMDQETKDALDKVNEEYERMEDIEDDYVNWMK
ncbi:hypothetical protein ACJ2A9_04950 [Anaerobacillus sp. MEB173]